MNAAELIATSLSVLGTGCWVVCFVWMHRISKRQETMLDELNAVAKRIEHFAKVEHDLIKEVHPRVEKIAESVNEIAGNSAHGR